MGWILISIPHLKNFRKLLFLERYRQNSQVVFDVAGTNELTGLEIRRCREPRPPLNSPAVPSNFGREPINVLVPLQDAMNSLEKASF